MIQDFEGTPEKVDLILVTHVAYYFHNSFRREMKKLMSMLSDNGALIFANKDDNHFNKALGIFLLLFDSYVLFCIHNHNGGVEL